MHKQTRSPGPAKQETFPAAFPFQAATIPFPSVSWGGAQMQTRSRWARFCSHGRDRRTISWCCTTVKAANAGLRKLPLPTLQNTDETKHFLTCRRLRRHRTHPAAPQSHNPPRAMFFPCPPNAVTIRHTFPFPLKAPPHPGLLLPPITTLGVATDRLSAAGIQNSSQSGFASAWFAEVALEAELAWNVGLVVRSGERRRWISFPGWEALVSVRSLL